MTPAFIKISTVLGKSLGLTSEQLINAFTRAERTDLPEICVLHRLGFQRDINENDGLYALMAWRYFNSRQIETAAVNTNDKNQLSDFFILRYQGRIIAAVGAEAVNIQTAESIIPAVRTGDIVVHPDFAKLGLGAWMTLYMQQHFAIVMAMGSNENSTGMVRRMFTPMKCRHHLKILFSFRAYLEHRGHSPFMAHLISILTAIPLKINRLLAKPWRHYGCSIKVVENTLGLTNFFNHPDYQPRSVNMALRSAAFCHWRYDQNPKSRFVIFENYRDNQLVGYAVVRRGHGNGNWLLMDWDLIPPMRNKQYLHILLSAVVDYVAAQKAVSLSVMASDDLSVTSLQAAGFSLRAVEDGFYLWASDNIAKTLFDTHSWFLSFADTDEAL